MKFKVEMCLLLMALVLFAVSAFFYSYHAVSEGHTFISVGRLFVRIELYAYYTKKYSD